MPGTLLHIDASARLENSTTRALSSQIVARLQPETVIRRDLSSPLPHITEAWVGANFTPVDHRDPAQQDILALSDTLVSELARADTLVIGLPIYNFSVPASLKAWIDLVARTGLTFKYTQTGPQGLLTGKRAILAVASGGTAVGSEIDFATGYLRHVLGFIGITDVKIIAADQLGAGDEAKIQQASAVIDALAA